MEPLGGIVKTRREELNLSQAELARAAGVHVRQIRRYESGEQQPVLAVAVKMAAALGVTLDELAGVARDNVRLEGAWWAAWEAGETVVSHPVQVSQHGTAVRLEATRHDRPGWLWRGELTLWDGHVLTGHYAGADGSPRSKGTMFFLLDPGDEHAEGRRVGLSYDGTIVSGHAALARDRDAAHAIVERLTRAVPSDPKSPVTP
jgi:transcriptional regulator with XRE-family HTH domain